MWPFSKKKQEPELEPLIYKCSFCDEEVDPTIAKRDGGGTVGWEFESHFRSYKAYFHEECLKDVICNPEECTELAIKDALFIMDERKRRRDERRELHGKARLYCRSEYNNGGE